MATSFASKNICSPAGSSRDVGSMPLSNVAYKLVGNTSHTFSMLFSIYDWHANDGYYDLGTWIEAAVRQAGC